MKVIHFASSFLPSCGGAITRLQNLLADLENKHYLYVPMPSQGQIPEDSIKLPKLEKYDNIYVKRCELLDTYRANIPLLKQFYNGFIKQYYNSNKLLKNVNENNFDIVHGHSPLVFARTASRYAQKNNLPFVYEFHRLWFELPLNNDYVFSKFIGKTKQIWPKFIDRSISKNANVIITQTTGYKESLTKNLNIDPEKIYIIPTGLDEKLFDPKKWSKEGEKLKKQKNWENKIVFLYNGYLSHVTGTKFFIESIKDLDEKIKNKIKIVVLGKGPLEEYIKKKSELEKDTIEFLGLVEYEKMPIYYNAADVQVIPLPPGCWAELGPPVKLFEGMAMENVILGSNVGGINEFIQDNYNGILFKKGSKKDLRDKISYIVDNFEDMKDIGTRARENIINKHNWENLRKSLQQIYKIVKE